MIDARLWSDPRTGTAEARKEGKRTREFEGCTMLGLSILPNGGLRDCSGAILGQDDSNSKGTMKGRQGRVQRIAAQDTTRHIIHDAVRVRV